MSGRSASANRARPWALSRIWWTSCLNLRLQPGGRPGRSGHIRVHRRFAAAPALTTPVAPAPVLPTLVAPARRERGSPGPSRRSLERACQRAKRCAWRGRSSSTRWSAESRRPRRVASRRSSGAGGGRTATGASRLKPGTEMRGTLLWRGRYGRSRGKESKRGKPSFPADGFVPPPLTPPHKGEGDSAAFALGAHAGERGATWTAPSPLWGSEGRARPVARPGKVRGGGAPT